ncbi:peptidoglycan editing factor PgeF [Sporosarcina thermotolerans]|uniref:Purine nucleoside phosphorylase n=1 Tax=Sporosarcina thermotolerans TaxID=633404 RepID=A0AAW9A6V2_9BACL|nr:peptidoglycan editing factor PgeF [Sporosarcina thermotolerans]MDW0116684.1 peptidoglycan editing factor PgeF [Sporosarcina thermotolerans]WHT48879.1 peptidoglycan editing factor PgeF [Sporosarcina thermotolerans]
MKTILYMDNEKFIAGTTLKDKSASEFNNMAFHACINPESVVENRKRLSVSLGCGPQDFVCASQTHSANFHKVTVADKGRGAEIGATAIPNTDALYTLEPNIVLCSFTADCVPVMFWNEVNGLIGVIHSGWQGTVKEITSKLFNHLKTVEACDLEDFRVQIGMALSQEKFEVDEDVYLRFKALGYADEFMYFNSETGKYHIDNQKTVKKQLELAGVPKDRITTDRTCTYLSEDGFSYRQDKKAGRHLSFVMRKAIE